MAGGELTAPAQLAANAAFAQDGWAEARASLTAEQCSEALALYDAQLVPVVESCPDLLSLDEAKVGRALDTNLVAKQITVGLKMLGRKVMPTASEEQVHHWLAAVTVSLCGLPAVVVLQALRQARIAPDPPRFAPEIEPLVRRCATEVQARYERARLRLRLHRDALERAANPPAALPPPDPPTAEDWHEFNAMMARHGFKNRFFFGEPCLDPDTGEPVPDSLGNMRALRDNEQDPARIAQGVAVDAEHESQQKDMGDDEKVESGG